MDLPGGFNVAAAMVVAVGVIAIRRLHRDRTVILMMALLPVGVIAMFIAWHGDGIETARHALEGNVIVRLAVVLLAAFALLHPGKQDRAANGATDQLPLEMP